jgi:sugar phosphate isomerase/epimerase
MKFGCCGSMIAPESDKTGIEIVESLAGIGYDYIELSLRDLMELPDATFSQLKSRIKASGILCESCNNFMPKHLKVTGNSVNTATVLSYAEEAMERAAEIGAKTIVFGSTMVRDIEWDFDYNVAFGQMADILHPMGELAAGYDMIVAIEHVNRIDGNIFTSIPETLSLVRTVNHPHIRLLIDYFHMQIEHETAREVLYAGDFVRHIHFARLYKRMFPRDIREDENYIPFFNVLKQIGYDYRISIEADTDDFHVDAASSLAFLKSAVEQVNN